MADRSFQHGRQWCIRRIIISDGSCTLQIKMVSRDREACVCAMCSMSKGQGLHVCMRAYLCNLLGSAVCCWPNPMLHAVATAFLHYFFWSLFVNLLCRKPEIESLGFTSNWLVLVGRLAWTNASCTYFRVADKFTTAKQKAETLYQILRDTQLSFGCWVGLAQLKETPAHRTAASLWLRSNSRRCTSEPTPHLNAPPAMFIEVTSATLRVHIQNKLFPQLGSRDVEFWNPQCTQQHQRRPAEAEQEIFAAPACPTGICHGKVRPLSQKGTSSLVGSTSPADPKMLAAVANRWADTELKVPSSSGRVKANDDGACLRLAHAQDRKWNPIAAAPGAAEGRAWAVSTVDCARSPHGESTFKRNRPSFAVLMVHCPRLRKSMATPVKNDQQLGNQTDQVWRETKPSWAYQAADS